MKKIFSLLSVALIINGCGMGTSSDDFVGSWRAENDQKKENQTFYIADRLIIEKDGEVFNASLLAQGVFTKMSYVKDKNLLCTEKGACFELVNKNTLRLGTANGIKNYIRED